MSKIEVNQISSQCGSTLTIGQSGDTVTLACGATAAGFGSTGEVSWDTTKKTTGFTAVSGVGYFCDTTSAAFTVTLPATPSAGNVVAVSDYNGTAGTNAITVGRNGSNINGSASDFIISKNNSSIQFIYVDATVGWQSVFTGNPIDAENPFIVATGGTVTCCGDYKIHTFTGPGTFTVVNAGSAAGSNSVDYLVVAGGGGGGAGCGAGGGGGAGGLRASGSTYSFGCIPAGPIVSPTGLPVTATAYPITVGAGGNQGGGTPAGLPSLPGNGGSGSNSIFSTITSAGGGGAAGANVGPAADAQDGGSGGGGARNRTPAGLGNTPPVSPPQGNPGGRGTSGLAGDGGGGSLGTGSNGGSWPGQPGDYAYGGNGGGGAGFSTVFGSNGQPSGCYQYFSGGGGGGNFANATATPAASGYGGLGGGGCGALASTHPNIPSVAGENGTTNTGGGGGGGSEAPTAGTPGNDGAGGSGGSGIVIIRYKYQ